MAAVVLDWACVGSARRTEIIRFPAAPHLGPLCLGKLHVSALRHKHHLAEKIYIR